MIPPQEMDNYKLQLTMFVLTNNRISLLDFISRLPRDKELLDFVANHCPTYIAFSYAKGKKIYSEIIEDRICNEAKELIVPWALTFGGSKKLRTAICQSEDKKHAYLYASIVDQKPNSETYEAVKDSQFYCDYCELIGIP
jgi:hypothetical protein